MKLEMHPIIIEALPTNEPYIWLSAFQQPTQKGKFGQLYNLLSMNLK